MTKSISVSWLRDHIAIGRQEADGPVMLLDRPVARGGQGLGFNGGHLMLMGLGACLKSVLLGAAEAREVPLDSLTIEVTAEEASAPTRYVDIRMQVHVVSSADEEVWEKLLKIAERGCQVSNTLNSAGAEIAVDMTVVTEDERPTSAPQEGRVHV